MNATIRNIQLIAALIVLAATVLAFFLEIKEMYINRMGNFYHEMMTSTGWEKEVAESRKAFAG